MKLVNKDLLTEEYEYDSSEERNEHIDSYGRTHIIKKIGGDGEKQPLFVIFSSKEID